MRSNVLQYGADWSDGVKLGPMGSDWVISHTRVDWYVLRFILYVMYTQEDIMKGRTSFLE